MKIAAFNGFPFHDEMFGYIIHFCKTYRHDLTIFCRTEKYNCYMEFYSNHFSDFPFTIIDCRLFSYYKYNYNIIFLLTDDDANFIDILDNDKYINNKTIRIDRLFEIRIPSISKCIAVRPFQENYRAWALPCYPIVSVMRKIQLRSCNSTSIVMLGSNYGEYDTKILNRIRLKNDKPIILHVISRDDVNATSFIGLDIAKFDVHAHINIPTTEMISILSKSDYVLTDVSKQAKYEGQMMAGVIPFAFSTLTPLIISKQSNAFYNFENVIEFDKNGMDDIVLEDIDVDTLNMERTKLVSAFSAEFSKIVATGQ